MPPATHVTHRMSGVLRGGVPEFLTTQPSCAHPSVAWVARARARTHTHTHERTRTYAHTHVRTRALAGALLVGGEGTLSNNDRRRGGAAGGGGDGGADARKEGVTPPSILRHTFPRSSAHRSTHVHAHALWCTKFIRRRSIFHQWH